MFDQIAFHFVNEYQGKSLDIATFGGPSYLGLIGAVPGASRVLYGFHNFYNYPNAKCNIEFLEKMMKSTIDIENSLKELGEPLEQDSKIVYATSAFTSNRNRKGDNRVYFMYRDMGSLESKKFKIEIDKIIPRSVSDMYSIRDREDRISSEIILRVLLNESIEYINSQFYGIKLIQL